MIICGIYNIFNIGEYVKIHSLYKYHSWYTHKLLKILAYEDGFYYLETFGNFHHSNVFQDDECLKLNRKEKLLRLNR